MYNELRPIRQTLRTGRAGALKKKDGYEFDGIVANDFVDVIFGDYAFFIERVSSRKFRLFQWLQRENTPALFKTLVGVYSLGQLQKTIENI